MKNTRAVVLGLIVASLFAIDLNVLDADPGTPVTTLFELLTPAQSGVDFENRIVDTEEYNIVDFIYAYNGGGVSVGDVNADGLPDLYFTGNQVANRLYLNRGNMRFEDASARAGVADVDGMSNGTTMVDIEGDGDIDIFVAKQNRPNVLFINNGDGTFVNRAREFGLDYAKSSTHGTFLDYDRDGDLDLYLTVNGDATGEGYARRGLTDRLYRNNGNNTFSDVTEQAGIFDDSYGLSATSGDLNDDGWPDIFVANDFAGRSLLYINQGDGTFREMMKPMLKHTATFGMGTDIADFNNDELLDLVEVDMLPEDHERKMKELGTTSVYSPLFDSAQQMRNVLHINRGNGVFSDIAFMAGVAKTDWSWAALFADYDNDGRKDLFITNGIKRDINDQDYLYNINKTIPKLQLLLKMPSTKLPDYMFRNRGDLTFENVSRAWGVDQPAHSNGAAYADLDLDGDLDLVVNNVDSVAFIYRNRAIETGSGNYLRVRLEGAGGNRMGIGARVRIEHGGNRQMIEHTLTRGFLSTVEDALHFGLGRDTVVTSVRVTWPSGEVKTLSNVRANQTITLKQEGSAPQRTIALKSEPFFTQIPPESGIDFRHVDNDFSDFSRERLLPNRLSLSGPGIAVGDVDGNGLEDVYIGGAKFQTGTLFTQGQPGRFTASSQPAFDADKNCEDMGALFFDADNDRDLDLYVVSGGNEYTDDRTPELQDRLYLNDGKGRFTKTNDRLPEMLVSGSSVSAADYDRDGDLDLFVAGRSVPGRYPRAPRSHLLENRKGTFVDVTEAAAPGLVAPGMITSSLWSDFDNDDDHDIVLVGEWMAPRFYRNDRGKFTEIGAASGVAGELGWWNSIDGGDFDNDGDIDYIVGNLGLNSKYQPTKKEPVELFARDFDRNGSLDLVVSYYDHGVRYPSRDKQSMASQMPILSRKFPKFAQYATATLEKMFGEKEIDSAQHFQATTFASSYLENLGGGKFRMSPLPLLAQVSPTFGTVIEDFNADGNLDILLAGNFFGPEPDIKRHDGGHGTLMWGNGNGTFTPLTAQESGFHVPDDARGIAMIADPKNNALYALVANSNGMSQLFLRSYTSGPGKLVSLNSLPADYTSLVLKLRDGRSRKIEVPMGSGYLTQRSPTIVVGPGAESLVINRGKTSKKLTF